MKVIAAGFPKTGTKSVCAALKQLDYKVYDYIEHFTEHGDDWFKIFNGEGTTEDFKRMYEDVDAVTDVPTCLFWDEIHKAFPDAKIIFTVRESEDEWYKSNKNHFKVLCSNWDYKKLILSPTNWRHEKLFEKGLVFACGYNFKMNGKFAPSKCNEMLMKMNYRRHNSHVLQTAPKDKLLVFNVKQGWKPLCAFLEVDVPTTPFPHENIKGAVVQDQLNHPLYKKKLRETKTSLCLIFLVLIFVAYYLFVDSTSWIRCNTKFAQSEDLSQKFDL